MGLGGRLDSTNVVNPAVTCITSIELEHTDQLGDTEAKIAGEKAGILKPDRPAVLGSLRPEAARVIRARANEIGAPVLAREEHFTIVPKSDRSGRTEFVYQENGSARAPFEIEVKLGVRGEAAVGNAGLGIACVRALDAHSGEELKKAAREGLRRCALPARIEVLANDPQVIVDAEHTAE